MTFAAAKLIVERIHREIGRPRSYTFSDYRRDQRLAISSAKRKRARQAVEAAQIAAFEQVHGREISTTTAENKTEELFYDRRNGKSVSTAAR